MSSEKIIKEKSYLFAREVVEVYKFLQHEKKEFIMSRQLLKSGTSIGANVRESQNAESTADFIHKLQIAQKECDESLYWLELLNDSQYLPTDVFDSLYSKANELLRLIRSAVITSKKNQEQNKLKGAPVITATPAITHNS